MFKHAVLLTGLLAFCASAHGKRPQPLTLPVAPSLPVELVLAQQELGVDVSNTGAAVTSAAIGGILGALVGSAITKAQVENAEKRSGEIRNLLVDYDFNQKFEAAIRDQLDKSGLAPELQIAVLHEARGWNEPATADYSAQPLVLVVQPRFAVTASFEALNVSMALSFNERVLKRNGKIKQLWKGSRNYTQTFRMEKLSGSGASDDAMRWTALGSAGLAALLDEGIAEIVEMMAYDLSPQGLADAASKNKGSVAFHGQKIPGRQVRADEQGMWVRSGNNLFASIQGQRYLTDAWVKQSAAAAPAADPTPATAEAPVSVDAGQ